MKSVLTLLVISLSFSYGRSQSSPAPDAAYIEAWKQFYPSQALDQGIHSAIFDYEDLSPDNIQKWLAFNKNMLRQLSDPGSPYFAENPIDARLLRIQMRMEIDQWERIVPHRNSLSLYATLIAAAIDPVFEASFLTAPEKARLICRRLASVQHLCTAAVASLTGGERDDLTESLEKLTQAEQFYREELPKRVRELVLPPGCEDLFASTDLTAAAIRSLITHVKTNVLPHAKETNLILGREEYARKLALYTDSSLTPEELATMALREIQHVRELMAAVSRTYLQKRYPDRTAPEGFDALVGTALADMEKDAPSSGEEYLRFWRELSDSAIKFIEERRIATLPKYQTLQILPAPESAGPAARIGWVESAPPFAPNPLTTLYLPSIPESLPEQDKKDFWASFNKPFNRMIVIHELFPGHYMQIKISRETPHTVRLLFPYGLYFEGWATFCERVLLDAGWERDHPLTFLAHLRKRLENANRAYTSVQVHCHGWDPEKVMAFSTKTSLLAPQFAKSLWGRLLRDPMQMTSYFLGGAQFTELLAAERKRLGPKFQLIDFMDTILRAGPIPIEEFYTIFTQTISK